MWLVPITTSPTPSAGSRPPATPHSIRARQSKRSSSSDGGDAGIDLARTRFDEHRLAAGDLAAPEGQAADFVRRARLVGEMGELLGQGRYDAQKPVCHGRMGYKVAASTQCSMPPSLYRATLRQACTDLAREAAREIMRIYAGDLGVRDKADKSPVTDADHAAEAIIVAGLRQLTPDMPVVAEEEMAAGRVPELEQRAVLAGRPARRHQGIHQEERRVHGEHRPDRGRPADPRHRAGAGHRHAVARRGGTGRRQEREGRRLHADRDARRRPPTASPPAPAAARRSTATSTSGSAARASPSPSACRPARR